MSVFVLSYLSVKFDRDETNNIAQASKQTATKWRQDKKQCLQCNSFCRSWQNMKKCVQVERKLRIRKVLLWKTFFVVVVYIRELNIGAISLFVASIFCMKIQRGRCSCNRPSSMMTAPCHGLASRLVDLSSCRLAGAWQDKRTDGQTDKWTTDQAVRDKDINLSSWHRPRDSLVSCISL